jgi:hemoglobin-like flavoprotein
MDMDRDARRLVKESWNLLEPVADAAAGLFLARAYALDPSLRSLFGGDSREQRRRLVLATTALVRDGGRPGEMAPLVSALARRFPAGSPARSTGAVLTALLWTLEHWLGGAFTPQVKAAWTEACLGLAADVQAHAALFPLRSANNESAWLMGERAA